MAKTKRESTKSSARRSRAEQFAVQHEVHAGIHDIGQIISWASRPDDNTTHTQQAVIDALLTANCSRDMAPDLLPKSAFTRACKILEDQRSIKVVDRSVPYTTFQFTAEFLDSKGREWRFKKEALVVLNEDNGKITCDIPELQQKAQEELDKHTALRTTADITRIVQKFFESQSDLIPFREQGGVYIVLKQHIHLVDQMETFLRALKGRMQRLTIYSGEGTKSDNRTIAECVEDYTKGLVEKLQVEVDGFTINTRNDTLERRAEEIKSLRLKIESVSHLMMGKAKESLDFVDRVNAELVAKVGGFAKQKEENPKTEGEARDKIFGHKVTGVMRWMRSQNWEKGDVEKVMKDFGISASKNTINAQFWRWENWRNSKDPKQKAQGVAAELSKDEEKKLKAVLKKVKGLDG